MNRALMIPGLLSSLLAVVAVAEMSANAPASHVPVPHFGTHPVAPTVTRALDTERLGDIILARPLFSSSRRPAQAPQAADAAHSAPRLSAIMIGGGLKRVVFDDDGHALVAREGGHAGPYTIVSIAADRVYVVGTSGSQTLRPVPIPADSTAPEDTSNSNPSGLSLLQQLQRGQVPHYAVPPPPSIQTLIQRMRAQR